MKLQFSTYFWRHPVFVKLCWQMISTLTQLDLEDNCIGPEGAVYLAEALQENLSVTHLVGTSVLFY